MINATYGGQTYNDVDTLVATDGTNTAEVTLAEAYAAADAGKVVKNNGGTYELAAQTARESNITVNGTYDTTDNNSVTVNVSGGSATLGTKSITENGTYNASSDNYDGYSQVTVNVSGGGGGSNTPVADTTIGQTTEAGPTLSFDITLSKTISKGVVMIEADASTLADIYADTSANYYVVSVFGFIPSDYAVNGEASLLSNGGITTYRGSTTAFAARAFTSGQFGMTVSGTTLTVSFLSNNKLYPNGTYNVTVWELADS